MTEAGHRELVLLIWKLQIDEAARAVKEKEYLAEIEKLRAKACADSSKSQTGHRAV